MLPKKIVTFSALLLFSFCFISLAAADVTLNPTGSNDQNQINTAIMDVAKAGGGEVHLTSGIYDISNTITMRSNIRLTGDLDAILRVSASYQWFTGQIGVISAPNEALHNVEISGFKIDGNIKNLPRDYDSTPGHDRDCEKIILFGGFSSEMGSNISIHDMTIYDSFSDGIYIRFTDGVYIYNNLISDCQHEGYYLACCRGGYVFNNKIAGICSDGGRLDNCQNFLIEYNTFISYSGPSYGAYEHGENALQIGNQGGSSHGYTPTAKPFTTENIEVTNNTFVSPGLQAFSLSGGENVYIHDNIYKDADKLTTSGFSVGNYSNQNYSYTNPPTLGQVEDDLDLISQLLDQNFVYDASINQSPEEFSSQVNETENGKIMGGVKIVGWKNLIFYSNALYVSSPNDAITKSVVIKNPYLTFWMGNIAQTDTDIKININDGLATAVMSVKVLWYDVTRNAITGRTTTGKVHTDHANFSDTVKSPNLWPDTPSNITAYANEFSGQTENFTKVHVPNHNTLEKIEFTYNNNVTTHFFMIGQSNTDSETGQKYTSFMDIDYWDGVHTGDDFYINETLDINKLTVTAYTPYKTIPLKIVHNYKRWDGGAFPVDTLYYLLKQIILVIGIFKLIKVLRKPT
jgi:hypothetical protein